LTDAASMLIEGKCEVGCGEEGDEPGVVGLVSAGKREREPGEEAVCGKLAGGWGGA